ncbi:MAG: D-alanine--D-alanine ligase [bacterium JZ-2024 1]
MTHQLKIAVLCGGWSFEREVSLRSGHSVATALKELGHEVFFVDVNRSLVPDLIHSLLRESVDLVFIALHGPFGEDGTLQGMLDFAGIPYTGSGVLASAVAMNKIFSKQLFDYHRIPTPQWVSLSSEATFEPIFKIPFPLVVKPADQGSTIGVSIVSSLEALPSAIQTALEYSESVLVEEYIPGREITVGILGDEPLEVVEIRPRSGFYDYRSKYTRGESEYLSPAPIPFEVREQVREMALRAHSVLNCAGGTRVDLRLDPQNRPFVLEVNTVPGLTDLSLLPMSAAAVGYDYTALVQRMAELALQRVTARPS